MNTCRKTHRDFFFACAFLRNTYGIEALTLEHIESGKWLSEQEIQDFTAAYLMGGEL